MHPNTPRLVFLTLAVLIWQIGTGWAQAASPGILTLDQARFFNTSAFGQRVVSEFKKRSDILAAENHRIEDDLKVEELALTEQRKTLAVADFRALADEFNVKVETIRAEQSEKTIALNKWAEAEQQRFVDIAYPELLKLATELGAAVILDQRSTIISASQVDVTDQAIERINRTIGDGVQVEKP